MVFQKLTKETNPLKDVMNTVTLLKHDPSLIFPYSHIQDGRELFEKVEDRLNFAELLESVTQPIHPTEVFDMIVGTSTGALISFALVGGNYRNGKSISKYVHLEFKYIFPLNILILMSKVNHLSFRQKGINDS